MSKNKKVFEVSSLFGKRRSVGGSLANNSAALGGSVGGASGSNLTGKAATSNSRYSPAVLKHLEDLNKQRAEEPTGTVTVEEMGQAAQEPDS